MSIHRSFRSANRLVKHRNVLTRTERIQKLEAIHKWDESQHSIFKLHKIRNIKVRSRKKVAEEAATEEESAAAAPETAV